MYPEGSCLAVPGEVDGTLLTEVKGSRIVRRHKYGIGEARVHQPRAVLLVVRVESQDTSTPFPLDPAIVALKSFLLRVLFPMVADVVRLVRAHVGVVHKSCIRAPVIPKPDALSRGIPMEEIVVFFGQRAVSARIEDTAKSLVCSAALIRVQMQHPLSITPCLQSEVLVRSVDCAPKQIHDFRGSLILNAPIIGH